MSEGATTFATCSDDAFLGGTLQILQPSAGYRAGIDAVLLAAAIPAKAGERVVEAGIGTGVAALCLARRVADVAVTGIEVNHQAAALARENARRNGLADRVRVVDGDISMSGVDWPKYGLSPDQFDHAFANPPYHDAARTRLPADPGRALAHAMTAGGLEEWARFLVAMTRPRGSVTVILSAELVGEALAAFARRLGRLTIYPLFAHADKPAIRVIVQGIKGSRAAPRLMPGLVLHEAGSRFGAQAQSVLREGAALAVS